jgi:hypothetical protein
MPFLKRLAKLTLIALLAIPLAGCVGIFKTKTVVINSVCTFPGLPFNYSQKQDTDGTIRNARALNDAWYATCPEASLGNPPQ